VLGEWPHGVTCHIAADGVITAAAPPDSGLEGIRLRRFTPGDLSAAAGLVSAPAGVPPEDDPATLAPRSPARHTSGAASPAIGSPLRGRAPAVPELSHDRPPPVPAPDVPVAGEPGSSKGSRPVRIGMLGPLQITAADREIGRGPRKARELLAFLAVHGADGATADAISEALWPGAPPGYGNRQRNVALRKARDLLRNSTGRSAPMWITHAAGRYRLDPSLIEVDLWQSQAALDAARTASTDQDRLAAYRQATGCYRGPLCDGAGFDWAEPHGEAARHRALDAWARIAGILQDTDPEQALSVMETALTHDPYNEYTYQQVMRLQAAAGRTDAVRRTLELLQSRLAELGISTLRTSTRQAVAALLGDSGPHPRSPGHPPAVTSTGKPSSAGAADRPRPPRPTRTRLPAIRRDR
jgi:DNA-binding SARP family transcriptional activator